VREIYEPLAAEIDYQYGLLTRTAGG
jgi:hypothetical protein